MSSTPRLAELLAPLNQTEVARRIGRTRDFVFRLRHGQPLTDLAVIPELARLLNLSTAMMAAIVIEDTRQKKLERRPKPGA